MQVLVQGLLGLQVLDMHKVQAQAIIHLALVQLAVTSSIKTNLNRTGLA